MDNDGLTWIEITKVGDHVADFNFWQAGKSPKDKPYSICQRRECLIFLLDHQRLGSRAKYKGFIRWEPVPFCEVDITAIEKAKITRFIAELPDASLLKEIKTLDQLYEWAEYKNICLRIAKCMLAGHGYPEDPLFQELEEGLIDAHTYNCIWFSKRLYQNLWELISQNIKFIKLAFEEQGWSWDFKYGREFVEKIIESDVNGQFANVLKEYHRESKSELKKIFKLASQSYRQKLSPEELKEFQKLKLKYAQPNIYLNRLINTCRILAKNNEAIKGHLEIHDAIAKTVVRLQLSALCNPKLKPHSFLFKWSRGFKDYA